MKNNDTLILGAGVTELAASLASKCSILKAKRHPGGICSSYYIYPENSQPQVTAPENQEVYRFEYGGGHWIFGSDPAILQFMRSLKDGFFVGASFRKY